MMSSDGDAFVRAELTRFAGDGTGSQIDPDRIVRAARRRRAWRASTAAAGVAVVVVATVATAYGRHGVGRDELLPAVGPSPCSATPAQGPTATPVGSSDCASSTPDAAASASASELPADEQVASTCQGAQQEAVVTVVWGVDGIPSPRCLHSRYDQRLTIKNEASTSILVTLGVDDLRVPANAAATFDRTLGEIVPHAGKYLLQFPTSGAELFVGPRG